MLEIIKNSHYGQDKFKNKGIRFFDMKCKICASKTDAIEAKNKIYHHCNKCDFIFLDEAFFVSEEKEKERYLKHQNSIENKGYVAMFEKFLGDIDKIKKNIKTALDFGSGPNDVLKQLLERKNIQTDVYDAYFATEKIFENKKYDLITCTEVLEHINNPLETLKLLKKHLNNKGILAIMTLFHPDIEQFNSWWYITDETHITFYNKTTFEIIAKKLGFNIIYLDQKNTILLESNSKV
jgi:SAM-dependent methyltransferase